jgi:hypothetical protein
VETDTTVPTTSGTTSGTSDSLTIKMDAEVAELLVDILGGMLTRVPALVHKTTHIPLTEKESKQLARALAMVMERRAQIVLSAGDDLLALALAAGMPLFMREMAARQEVEARKKAQQAQRVEAQEAEAA